MGKRMLQINALPEDKFDDVTFTKSKVFSHADHNSRGKDGADEPERRVSKLIPDVRLISEAP